MERRLINKMIRAMKITKNDVVLVNFWGTKDQNEDLNDFIEELGVANITYIINDCTDEKLIELIEEYPGGIPENWFEKFAGVTVAIDIMEKPIGLPPAGIDKEKIPVFGKILSDLFGFVSQNEKVIQITMPSKANATMAGCEYEAYKKRIISALDVDYDELQKECTEKISMFEGNKRILKTGDNCVLEVDTTGREWNIDAGEGAFPCGEIYIAVIEEATNGTIFFEKLSLDGNEIFEDVILTIENGHLVDSNCKEVMAFFKRIPEKGADIVAELGIGMNPMVQKSGIDATLEEDALGTFHIAFGMNAMFGGKNMCRFHMDFVTEGEIL